MQNRKSWTQADYDAYHESLALQREINYAGAVDSFNRVGADGWAPADFEYDPMCAKPGAWSYAAGDRAKNIA